MARGLNDNNQVDERCRPTEVLRNAGAERLAMLLRVDLSHLLVVQRHVHVRALAKTIQLRVRTCTQPARAGTSLCTQLNAKFHAIQLANQTC